MLQIKTSHLWKVSYAIILLGWWYICHNNMIVWLPYLLCMGTILSMVLTKYQFSSQLLESCFMLLNVIQNDYENVDMKKVLCSRNSYSCIAWVSTFFEKSKLVYLVACIVVHPTVLLVEEQHRAACITCMSITFLVYYMWPTPTKPRTCRKCDFLRFVHCWKELTFSFNLTPQYISKLVLPTCSGFCKNRTQIKCDPATRMWQIHFDTEYYNSTKTFDPDLVSWHTQKRLFFG